MICVTEKRCEIRGTGAELLADYSMITRTLLEKLPAAAVDDAYMLGKMSGEEMKKYIAIRMIQMAMQNNTEDDSEDDDIFGKMFGDLFN